MANEIDRLMDEDPLNLSAREIDDIIVYMRKMLQNFEAGIKPKKESGPKVALSLEGLGFKKPEPVAKLKRRF